MKTRAFVSIFILVLAVLIIAGSCATGKKASVTVNPDFIRQSGNKLVFGENNQEIMLRGVNFTNDTFFGSAPSTTHHSETDFQRVKDMGMNVVRFHLSYKFFEDDDSPYVYKQTGWNWIDQNVIWAKKYGIT